MLIIVSCKNNVTLVTICDIFDSIFLKQKIAFQISFNLQLIVWIRYMANIFPFMYDHGVHGLSCVGLRYFLTLLDFVGLRNF